MRRAISSSLLLFFSLMLLAPLLAAFGATAEENLPACCRRDGKHQCARRAAVTPIPGPAFRNLPTRCGQYPSAPSLTASHATASVVAQPVGSLPVVSTLAASPTFGAWVQSTPAAPLRGPPAPLA